MVLLEQLANDDRYVEVGIWEEAAAYRDSINGEYVIVKGECFRKPWKGEGEIQDGRYEHVGEVLHYLVDDILKEIGIKGKYEIRFNLIDNFEMVIAEPILNAEMHGNRYSPDKITKVEYRFREEGAYADFYIKVTDQGEGFDYKAVLEELDNAEEEWGVCGKFKTVKGRNPDSRGAGIFRMLKIADSVEWSDSGRCIELTKRLYPV